MTEHTKPFSAEKVLVGSWNAIRRYPEWWGRQTVALYDRLRFPAFTPEERKVDDAVHRFLTKHQKAVGWAETGLQAVLLSLAVRKGYRWLKGRHGLTPPVPVTEHIPNVPPPPQEIVQVGAHMVGSEGVRTVPAVVRSTPIEESGIEMMRVPPSLYQKGILVPADAPPLDPVNHDPALWNRVLQIDPGHPDKAKGLIIASAHHLPVAFAESQPYIGQQLRSVNRVLRQFSGDYMEHLLLAPLLPKEDLMYTDPTRYERALTFLQLGFEKHAKKWSILRPDVAFGFWASTYFPFLHVVRNAAIDRPGNHAAMWGLKLAYNRYGWKI